MHFLGVFECFEMLCFDLIGMAKKVICRDENVSAHRGNRASHFILASQKDRFLVVCMFDK